MTKYKWSKTSIRRMNSVDKRLVKCVSYVLENKAVNDLIIPWMGGKRSAEEQNILFKKGVSKCDGFVNLSDHQSGLALDIIPYNVSKLKTKRAFYIFACQMFQAWIELKFTGKLKWGGNFKNAWDMPHWYISE